MPQVVAFINQHEIAVFVEHLFEQHVRRTIVFGDFREDVAEVGKEFFRDCLDIECFIVMLLNGQRRQTAQFRTDNIETKKRNPLGRSSQPLVRPDSDAAKDPALVSRFVVFDVQEVPAPCASFEKTKSV